MCYLLDHGLSSQLLVLLGGVGNRLVDSGVGGLEESLGPVSDLLSLGLGDSLFDTVVVSSLLSKDLGIGVESPQEGLVLQRVLLGGSSPPWLWLGWVDGSLDLVGVDDLGNISEGDNRVAQMESLLELGASLESTEVVVEALVKF